MVAVATLAVIAVVIAGIIFAAGAVYARLAPCTGRKLEATHQFAAFLEDLPEVEEVVITTHDWDSGVTPQIEITATDKEQYWVRIKSSLECTDAPRYPEESRKGESLHCVHGDYTYLLGWGYARIAQ
jgi:hypothetical protein